MLHYLPLILYAIINVIKIHFTVQHLNRITRAWTKESLPDYGYYLTCSLGVARSSNKGKSEVPHNLAGQVEVHPYGEALLPRANPQGDRDRGGGGGCMPRSGR